MKRIFTLLIALGAMAVAEAQYSRSYPDDRNRDRDVILGQRNDRVYDNNTRYTYAFSERDRDREIDRINNEYNKRIRRIEKDRRMSSYNKSYEIRNLEGQRREDIRRVWERFRSPNNLYNNGRYPQNNRRW